MTKPLAFNYGHYETLRDKANDMAIEIAELNDKVKELQKENDELKRLNEGYTKMLAKSQSTVNKLLVAGLKLQAEVNAAKPSADAVQGYAEWLEKIIVDAKTLEWLCEDTPCKKWCDENCHYSSIQAECLRHLYEVSKGGAE